MSRQRKKKQQSNPFKSLKGFCVSPAPKPPESNPPETSETPPVSPADENELFRREMSHLRVKGKPASEEPPEASVEEEARTGKEACPADEQEVFLAAIGKLEKTFTDEILEPAPPSAMPRRMKLLRAGKMVPEAELDLHGLDRARAREKTRHFLDDSVYQGKKTVLLITGKGHGSAGEPVLRGEMERFLAREAGAWVSEWGKAPRRYGGEGALVVFLRGKKGGKSK